MNRKEFVKHLIDIFIRLILLVAFTIIYIHFINCAARKEFVRVKDRQLEFTCTQLYHTKKEILDCIADRYSLFMDILNGTGKEVKLIDKERIDLYVVVETYSICYSDGRFCEYIQVSREDKHFIVKVSEYSFFIAVGFILKTFLVLQ